MFTPLCSQLGVCLSTQYHGHHKYTRINVRVIEPSSPLWRETTGHTLQVYQAVLHECCLYDVVYTPHWTERTHIHWMQLCSPQYIVWGCILTYTKAMCARKNKARTGLEMPRSAQQETTIYGSTNKYTWYVYPLWPTLKGTNEDYEDRKRSCWTITSFEGNINILISWRVVGKWYCI